MSSPMLLLVLLAFHGACTEDRAQYHGLDVNYGSGSLTNQNLNMQLGPGAPPIGQQMTPTGSSPAAIRPMGAPHPVAPSTHIGQTVTKDQIINSIIADMSACGIKDADIRPTLVRCEEAIILDLQGLIHQLSDIFMTGCNDCLKTIYSRIISNIRNVGAFNDIIRRMKSYIVTLKDIERCRLLLEIVSCSGQASQAVQVISTLVPAYPPAGFTTVFQFISALLSHLYLAPSVTFFVSTAETVNFPGACLIRMCIDMMTNSKNCYDVNSIEQSLVPYLATQPGLNQCQLMTPICQFTSDIGQPAILFQLIGVHLVGHSFTAVSDLVNDVLVYHQLCPTLIVVTETALSAGTSGKCCINLIDHMLDNPDNVPSIQRIQEALVPCLQSQTAEVQCHMQTTLATCEGNLERAVPFFETIGPCLVEVDAHILFELLSGVITNLEIVDYLLVIVQKLLALGIDAVTVVYIIIEALRNPYICPLLAQTDTVQLLTQLNLLDMNVLGITDDVIPTQGIAAPTLTTATKALPVSGLLGGLGLGSKNGLTSSVTNVVPFGELTHTVPVGHVTQAVPVGSLTSGVTGSIPVGNVGSRGRPKSLPGMQAGGLSSPLSSLSSVQGLSGGLPTSGLTGGLTGGLTNGLPTQALSGGLPTSGLTGGLTGGLANGLPTQGLTNGLPTQGLTSGLPTGSLTGGLGGLTGGITGGMQTPSAPSQLGAKPSPFSAPQQPGPVSQLPRPNAPGAIPSVPSIPAVPGVPPRPSLPSLPQIPGAATPPRPAGPGMVSQPPRPSLPSLPQTPGAATPPKPAVPGMVSQPPRPGLPSLPQAQGAPGLPRPGVPSSPSIPFAPGAARQPSPPVPFVPGISGPSSQPGAPRPPVPGVPFPSNPSVLPPVPAIPVLPSGLAQKGTVTGNFYQETRSQTTHHKTSTAPGTDKLGKHVIYGNENDGVIKNSGLGNSELQGYNIGAARISGKQKEIVGHEAKLEQSAQSLEHRQQTSGHGSHVIYKNDVDGQMKNSDVTDSEIESHSIGKKTSGH